MVINDYYDREIDAINEPDRPIPSGLIRPKEALAFAFALTTIGFAAAYLTNISSFVIAILTWIVFVTYTTVGKRSGLPGNFLVSICVVDVEGDRTKNIRTLAVRYGEKTAAVVAALFYLSAVLLSPIPWFLNLVSLWFIPLVAITDFGLAASSFMLLQDYSRGNARKVKKIVLLWFIIALLAFVVGAVR